MPSAVQEHVDAFPLHSEKELAAAWREVEVAWRDNMKRRGVRPPAENTANSLGLSILWLHRHDDARKRAIAENVTRLRPDLFGDQRVRHLKSQGGRAIGGRGWRRIDFNGVNPDWLIRQARRGDTGGNLGRGESKARFLLRPAPGSGKGSAPVQLRRYATSAGTQKPGGQPGVSAGAPLTLAFSDKGLAGVGLRTRERGRDARKAAPCARHPSS